MKKWIIGGIIVLALLGVGALAVNSMMNGGLTGGFTTQQIVIQGKQVEVFASKSELDQTFSLTVPAPQLSAEGQAQAMPEKPLTFMNPGGCTCYALDADTKLPTGTFDCSTGVQAPTGQLFSAFCPTPNSDFYLTR